MPLLVGLSMTAVCEAGRRGGTQTERKHGPESYKPIGRNGGETTKLRHGHECASGSGARADG
jgi:general stress protein YciG